MNYLGIQYEMKNPPPLDPGFIPFGVWAEAYLSEADHPISIAVEREDGKIHAHRSFLRGEEYAEANCRYLERLVKLLLWSVGGFRVILCGCDALIGSAGSGALTQTSWPRSMSVPWSL